MLKPKLFKEAYSDMHTLMAKIASSGLLEAIGDSESEGDIEIEEANEEEGNDEVNDDEANKENCDNVNMASKSQSLSKPMFGLNNDDPLLVSAPLSAAASNIVNNASAAASNIVNTASFCLTETSSSVAPLAVPIGGVSAPAAIAPIAPALSVPASVVVEPASSLLNNDHSYSALPVPVPVAPAMPVPAPVTPATAAPAPAPLPDPSLPLPFI